MHKLCGLYKKHHYLLIGLVAVITGMGCKYFLQDSGLAHDTTIALILIIVALVALSLYFWLQLNYQTAEQSEKDAIEDAKKQESIGVLAGGIAHEFNNLLQGVVAYATILRDIHDSDVNTVEKLDKIIFQSKRGAKLTKSLLSYARKSSLKMEPLDLEDLCIECAEIIRPVLGSNIVFSLKSYGEPLFINGDHDSLIQVLSNVFFNAKEAITDKGKIQFELNKVEENGVPYAEIIISDTGHGIHKDFLGKIFEPFYTTKEVGESHGLGLSMVYGTVKKHRGEVKVESELNKGSVFTINLPLMDEKEIEQYKERTIGKTVALGEEEEEDIDELLEGKICLLVDDEPLIIEVLTIYLETLGAEVIALENPEETLDALNQNDVDIIFLDWIMPNLSGQELHEKIRKINQAIPIIFSTGYTELGELKQAIGKDENYSILSKPYQIENLVKVVKEIKIA